MDIDMSPQDRAFRDEVRVFLSENVPPASSAPKPVPTITCPSVWSLKVTRAQPERNKSGAE